MLGVERVGAGVDPSWVGKRVAVVPEFDMRAYGLAGETALVPAKYLVEMPAMLSFEEGRR
jgi:NADPH:quinone reductase-like Zn-dependent oxidoreductase